jgi:hypothetical protein
MFREYHIEIYSLNLGLPDDDGGEYLDIDNA